MNEVWKALADGTRRDILRLLQRSDLNAGDIASHFAISRPSISHHLNVLKRARLVLVERQGQELIYSLNTTVMQDTLATLMELFGGEEDGNL